MKIPLEISARHIHLSQSDLEILFGKNHKLQKLKDLSQPGQFAARETIKLVGPKGEIDNVRIIGPQRARSQVEISKTDGFILGIVPPPRLSGDVVGSPGIKIVGPKGEVNLVEGLIIAKRHLHISLDEAKNLKVKHGDLISIKVEGERGVIFNNVVVRVDKNFRLACQLDTDEANAAGVKQGYFGWLVKPKISNF
jgi:propanediol utilization protein